MEYRTPGVYVEEISLFPPSVAAVETAIPAFIGYTETNSFQGENLEGKAIRLSSLLEYQERYGYGPPISVNNVSLDADNNIVESTIQSTFYFYDSLRMFFNNGGGDCYIISVGTYKEPFTVANLQSGLEKALFKTDEPTLIVIPDGAQLEKAQLASLYQLALQQCQDLKDRFAILDVHMSDTANDDVDFTNDIDDFRARIGTRNLSYGAAYYPYVQTNIGRDIKYRDVMGRVSKLGSPVNWSTFIDPADTDLANLITAIDQIVTDNTTLLEPDMSNFLVTEQASFPDSNINSLEAIYLTLENSFQTILADPASTAGGVRTEFVNLIEFIYQIADLFLDEYADDSGTPSSISHPGLLALIRTQCDSLTVDPLAETAISPTLDTLAKIDNAATVGANSVFGAPASFPIYSAGTTWEYSAAGPAAFAGTFLAANNTLTNINPLLPNPTASSGAERIQNMGAISPILRRIFYRTYAAISQIYTEALNIEKQAETSLILQIPVLKNVIDKLSTEQFVLPPSGAIAGLYASVDSNQGVYKAPANVSLNAINAPVATISISDNDRLNVDTIAGKSINAIKSVVGKGTLVWGARTLAGNDNEWRYIPVRRFFIFAEESIKKATEQFIFEPNDLNTWIKVKAMIENFLTNQWRDGALAGAKPSHAFFVKVGLGDTMTAVDILEGKMIVEIGMAVVRPAEFIILRFSHKMQES